MEASAIKDMLCQMPLILRETMRPTRILVYNALALYLGCMSTLLILDNKITGAVIAASFLLAVFFTIRPAHAFTISCFLAFGAAATLVYYNFAVPQKTEEIRVVNNKDYYSIAKWQGRKITVIGLPKGINEGDKVAVRGKFEDKKDYYRGIIGTFYADKTNLESKDFLSSLYGLRRSIYTKFEGELGKERAALITSLCFGDTEHLSQEQLNEFQKLGVVHAISVSGFHMAVIYSVLEHFLGIWVSMLVSLLYLIFTGMQPATYRAFIMILILKLSKKLYKNYDGLSSLSLSAIVILSISPYFAADLGFNLSYLATLGIILFYNKIKREFYRLPIKINEPLSLTLSAQVFSMPYAAMSLGKLSFGFLPGNLVLLPVYTIIVLLGNLALVFSLWPLIFKIVGRVIYIFTIILDGANYLLLKITPEVTNMTYLNSLLLMVLIGAFLLVKKGYDKYRMVPLFVLPILFLSQFSFVPQINFVNLVKQEGVIVSYNNKDILLCSSENMDKEAYKAVEEKFKPTKVLIADNKEVVLKLRDSCYLKLIPSKSSKGNIMSLNVIVPGRTTILTRETQEFMDLDTEKYDIIELPKKKFLSSFNSRYFIEGSYDIIFNKVFDVSVKQ